MTYGELANALAAADPSAALTLRFDGAAPPKGLHITELRRAAVDAMDCGGRRDGWEEATLQILFGGEAALTVGTAAGILAKGRAAFPGIEALLVRIEASPTGPLALYQVDRMEAAATTLHLTSDRPLCKPARDFAAARAAAAAKGRPAPKCCG